MFPEKRKKIRMPNIILFVSVIGNAIRFGQYEYTYILTENGRNHDAIAATVAAKVPHIWHTSRYSTQY